MALLKRCAVVAIFAVTALVPATAASAAHRPARLRLALVPLQTAQLGPANASLALDYGSGPMDNNGGLIIVIGTSSGSTQIGPLAGYALDYGDPYAGSTGLMEIRSSVEEYRSRAAARTAFRFTGFDDEFLDTAFAPPFVKVTEKKIKPLPVGQRRAGRLTTQAAPHLNPIVKLDEQVVAGRFVLDLTVTAGSASAAREAAPHLLRVRHRRLQLLLGGHATGKPPKLPPEPTTGQALGAPDLSTLILQPPDVGQSHAVNLLQTYVAAPPTLSDFLMELAPAGSYTGVLQQIGWWSTATEATYGEAYGGGFPGYFGLGLDGTVTPVDLSGVGDGATGYLIDGGGESAAYVTLSNGQARESVIAESKSTLHASDVQSLAQAAANRLDAGLGP
jgi:hypothetical protein